MEDLKIVDSKMYALAGDYFMDIIGSAHAMYYNKDIINNQYGDKDLMYKHVLDGTWTLDTMTKYVSELYQDLNGNGKNDADDQYGYSSVGMWGPVIPFVIGSDINFVERSDSGLSFGFNNERSISLLEKLNALFYSQGTTTAISDVASMLKAFSNGNTVFTGYLRLSDLANLRDIDFEVGILPYPKLDENQENYVTSSHDTTEIGAIPITAAANVDFISTITEILCRETSKQIIPVYYETALKVKYTRDDLSAQMIDIIHDNFGSTFPLAYASLCGNIFISESFCTPLQSKNTDFASNFAKREKSAVKNLNKLYEQVAALD